MSAEITAWLDEAQATADAATEGPWSAHESVDGFSSSVFGPRGCVAAARSTPSRELRTDELGPRREGRRREDAAFIADARTRLPQAIAALRAVEAKLGEVQAWQPYQSRDTGEVFAAGSVEDLVDEMRAAIAAALAVQL